VWFDGISTSYFYQKTTQVEILIEKKKEEGLMDIVVRVTVKFFDQTFFLPFFLTFQK
jgi:hypothetical protein